jgi:hypothetical protein
MGNRRARSRPMRRWRWIGAFALGIWLLGAGSGFAADERHLVVTGAEVEPELRIFVLTFGPGDHPFFKFGHNAIGVQAAGQQPIIYNWGTFDFESPTLFTDFLRGRLTYWLSMAAGGETLREYQLTDRTIELQELDLSPADKQALARRLAENARPENRKYLYDYFWDNCSTRVRDAIDGATGGRLKAAMQTPAHLTYRHQALRLTSDLWWEYLGLHFGLGRPTDLPATRWQEAFIPEVLHDQLRELRIPGEHGDRPLVKGERVLYHSTRPDPPAREPHWLIWFALAGLVAGGLAALLGRASEWRLLPRLGFALYVGVLGLVAGLLGAALVFLWAFTNHQAAHANANLLPCPPFVLALVPLAVGLGRGRMVAAQSTFYLAIGAAVSALVGLVAKALPGVAQDNVGFILFFLPLWLGIAYGARRLGGSGG